MELQNGVILDTIVMVKQVQYQEGHYGGISKMEVTKEVLQITTWVTV